MKTLEQRVEDLEQTAIDQQRTIHAMLLSVDGLLAVIDKLWKERHPKATWPLPDGTIEEMLSPGRAPTKDLQIEEAKDKDYGYPKGVEMRTLAVEVAGELETLGRLKDVLVTTLEQLIGRLEQRREAEEVPNRALTSDRACELGGACMELGIAIKRLDNALEASVDVHLREE